jgi:peptidyl-prolyl cis-trans isomerase-like 1
MCAPTVCDHPFLSFPSHPIFPLILVEYPAELGFQFFITLAPTLYLDNRHTIFGRVSLGMRVVQRLGAVAVGSQDK